MPLAPRLPRIAPGARAGRQEGVEVAYRHGVAGDERRAVGQNGGEVYDDAGLRRCVFQQGRANRRASRRLGALPGGQPAGLGAGCAGGYRSTHGRRVRVHDLVGVEVRVGPFARRGDLDLAHVAVGLEVGRQRPAGGRRAEPQDVVGAKRARQIRVTQEVIVGAEDRGRRAATGARDRVGEYGCVQRLRQALDVSRVEAGLRPADDKRAPRRQQAVERKGERCGCCLRLLPGPGSGSLKLDWRRDQRFAEGEVDVDGAARAPQRRRDGAIRYRLGESQHVLGRLGQRHLGEPLHGRAVQVGLVDGLVGAEALQLGRSVRRQDDQRDVGVIRLDDGRREVDGRGAGTAQDGDGLAGGFRHAQREVGAGALVEVHPGLDGGVALEGQRQRRRARAGAEADVLDAGGDEFIDEGADVATEDLGVRQLVRQGRGTPSPSSFGGESRQARFASLSRCSAPTPLKVETGGTLPRPPAHGPFAPAQGALRPRYPCRAWSSRAC